MNQACARGGDSDSDEAEAGMREQVFIGANGDINNEVYVALFESHLFPTK